MKVIELFAGTGSQTQANYCKYCGKQLERKRFGKRLEDFGVFKKRKYCDRNCMRKAFIKIDAGKQSYSTAHGTARAINALILGQNECEICGKVGILDVHHKDIDYQNNNTDNLMVLCRSCHMKRHRPKATCSICGKPAKGLGYCEKHYQRYKKYGNPYQINPKGVKDESVKPV